MKKMKKMKENRRRKERQNLSPDSGIIQIFHVIFSLRLYPTSAPDKRSPSSQWIRKKKKGREKGRR